VARSSDALGIIALSQGHYFSLDEINAAQKIKEREEAEERALNKTAQKGNGKEKVEERTLNETPTNATTQKCRQAAKTSTRPRVRLGSGYAVSWTPLPGPYGTILR
jgi:hypothetical protein